jgi:hypothetical protein
MKPEILSQPSPAGLRAVLVAPSVGTRRRSAVRPVDTFEGGGRTANWKAARERVTVAPDGSIVVADGPQAGRPPTWSIFVPE